MIPKILHFIWVGDESKRPDNCIQTWVQHNPLWSVKVWGNAELANTKWINSAHMRQMATRELNGVADMMRWEILFSEGGFLIDADSICLRALDEELLNLEAFACWESEVARPGLIAAGYFACSAGNSFVHQIIQDIHNEPSVIHKMAWETVGPQRLTESYRRYQYQALHILPSHYFIPEHFSGIIYNGPGPVYASQKWGSTKSKYGILHLVNFDEKGNEINNLENNPSPSQENLSPDRQLESNQPALSEPEVSKLESLHDPYFVQRVKVSREIATLSRLEVFSKLCSGQRVMHIGCADWPITDPTTSLHLALEPHCKQLDGFDVHSEALAGLAPYAKGRLYSNFEDISAAYDLILAPEVMEHVPDIENFLAQLDSLNAPSIVITVPDAFQCRERRFDYVDSTEMFVEIIHPDHNCWYTPFTFSNVIKKYTPWHIEGLWFFNGISLMALLKKPAKNVSNVFGKST